MFRAAKEMIEKRFGRIWNPTGAKKMPTLGRKKPLNIVGGYLKARARWLCSGGSLSSRGFQSSELRRTRRSKPP